MKATTDRKLVSLVHMANALCQYLDFGASGNCVLPEMDLEVLQVLGIDSGHIETLTEIASDQLEDAEAFPSALGN